MPSSLKVLARSPVAEQPPSASGKPSKNAKVTPRRFCVRCILRNPQSRLHNPDDARWSPGHEPPPNAIPPLVIRDAAGRTSACCLRSVNPLFRSKNTKTRASASRSSTRRVSSLLGSAAKRACRPDAVAKITQSSDALIKQRSSTSGNRGAFAGAAGCTSATEPRRRTAPHPGRRRAAGRPEAGPCCSFHSPIPRKVPS